MVSYDPRGMTWDQWSKLTAELFARQDLGTMSELRWQEWAAGFSGVGYFLNSGVPDPTGFADWRDWAERLVGILTVEPQ